MKGRLTLDEALTPITMTCGKCGGQMKLYPTPKGVGVCPNCSPAWLSSFALHLMNTERAKHGLVKRELAIPKEPAALPIK